MVCRKSRRPLPIAAGIPGMLCSQVLIAEAAAVAALYYDFRYGP